MKKIIFVLTYSEGDRWINHYTTEKYKKYFAEDYQLIFLDNGDQDNIKKWAKDTGSIYHRSENNIGTTGGYNWFIHVGNLLNAPRIAVMQADVLVHNPVALSYLFNKPDGSEWERDDFVYWPNFGKSTWDENGNLGDVGQFFSVNPSFFLENEYLCDENYTVTHFESIDLWVRMTNPENKYPAKPNNLLNLYFPEEDLDTTLDEFCSIYSYYSYSNRNGEHDQWFKYNWEYFEKKYVNQSVNISDEDKFLLLNDGMFKTGPNPWCSAPWVTTPEMEPWAQLYLHRKVLDPNRNIKVNQLPYPVEWEVNRFYKDYIKSKDEPIKKEIVVTNLNGVANLNKSILIIGSSGYIGTALNKYLKDKGYLVTTVDLKWFGGPTPDYKENFKDLSKEFYSKFTYVILLAGHSSMTMCANNYEEAWENNVTNFSDLISKLTEKQTLIYSSSGSVYGQGGQNRNENMTLAPAQNEYDLTKQMIEKIASGARCRTVGLRFATLNGASDYSRSDLMINSMVISAKTQDKIVCYNGKNHRSILGMQDCVRAIQQIIDKTDKLISRHEVFNLSSINGTINSFAKEVANILNVKVENHSKITNVFSFELDSTKFIKTFGFTFRQTTIDIIVKEILNKYEKIIWSNRIPMIEIPAVEVDNKNVEEPVIENSIIYIEDDSEFEDTFDDSSVISKIEVNDVPEGKYKRLTKCLCCENTDLFVILDLQSQPPANSFHKPEEILPIYELKLMGCDNCWHTQLSIAVDPKELFSNYIYVSGTSQTLKEYFDWNADQCTNFVNKVGKVLDIACNDGTQLDSFKERGWLTYGVDPAKNLYSTSTEKGHEVICDFWNTTVASTLPKMDLITAQNVFAHTSEVDEFLQACKLVMHMGTVLLIQTSQANMFENNEFDTIYHEHISYFSVSSMKTLVERNGLYLNHVWKPNVHGMSYLFEIGKSPKESPNVKAELENEKFRHNRNFYIKYRANAMRCLSELKEYIEHQTFKVIGYGAAAKGMTVLNAGGIKLDYIIDDNPLKQGLLCPGSNIPVKDSSILDTEGNLIIIPLAWNFYNEIYDKIKYLRPASDDKFIKYFPNLNEQT